MCRIIMRIDNRNTNQIGGEIIGKGAYGCVFRPPLRCIGHTHPSNDMVSKLMLKDDAKQELNEFDKIDKLDPTYQFHLRKPLYCYIEHPTHAERVYMEQCYMFQNKGGFKNHRWNKEFALLQMEDGGETLTAIFDDVGRRFSLRKGVSSRVIMMILKSLQPLFKGLVQMHKYKFCHLDIKSDNIVFNPKTLQCKYIDFGLSSSFNNVYKKEYILKDFYYILPSEIIYLLHYKYFNVTLSKSGFSTLVKALHEFLYHNYNNSTKSYMKTFDKLNVEKSIYKPSYTIDSIKKYKALANSTTKKKFNTLLVEKIDTFSLGIVLLELWVLITKKKFDNTKTTYENILRGDDKKNKIMKQLFIVINGMIQPSYNKRFSPSKANNEFNKIGTL